jgi:hypothetical protein
MPRRIAAISTPAAANRILTTRSESPSLDLQAVFDLILIGTMDAVSRRLSWNGGAASWLSAWAQAHPKSAFSGNPPNNPEMMEWKPSLMRNATPDEISDVAGFLAGEASMFTGGQVPRVDGVWGFTRVSRS